MMTVTQFKSKTGQKGRDNIKSNDQQYLIDTLEGAVAHFRAGRLQQAEAVCHDVLEHDPDNSDAWHMFGVISCLKGDYLKAFDLISKAIASDGTNPAYFNSLGNVLRYQGKLYEALEFYTKALHLKPDFPEAHNNLGTVLRDQGRLDEAMEYFTKALHLKPDFPEALNNLANTLRNAGKLDEAIDCCRTLLQHRPDSPEIYSSLGILFRDQGKLNEAIEYSRKAIELKPDFPEAYNILGIALRDQGKLDEAIECFQKALQLNPDLAFVHSNLLLSLHYHDQIEPVQLFSQHKRWSEQHASAFLTTIKPCLNDSSPSHRLRIGYISPDFRKHSVAYFIEPVIASHDRAAFEVFCYSDVVRPDSATDRFKGLVNCWRNIVGLSDEQVADLIRKDKIDILVDLAGHTANNRLLLFAAKPAPVQATYLGYPNTTGLATIDYRITDSCADPPGKTDHLYTEELVRLPHGFLCYKPNEEAPEVGKLPAHESGIITFGSFNYSPKISSEVVRLWSEILALVPNSQLVLKSNSLSDTGARERMKGLFVQNNVSPNRIRLLGFVPSIFNHLELYNTIDIGLDTFPYNGTTTTCEAMWMGVPVIVLAGQAHVSRVGVSLLSSAGLTDLIAESAEAYLGKAVKLADNLGHLQDLRMNLRAMMLDSPLTDAGRFVCALEKAYRQMWHHWCDQPNGSDYSYVETPGKPSSHDQLLIEKQEAKTE